MSPRKLTEHQEKIMDTLQGKMDYFYGNTLIRLNIAVVINQ